MVFVAAVAFFRAGRGAGTMARRLLSFDGVFVWSAGWSGPVTLGAGLPAAGDAEEPIIGPVSTSMVAVATLDNSPAKLEALAIILLLPVLTSFPKEGLARSPPLVSSPPPSPPFLGVSKAAVTCAMSREKLSLRFILFRSGGEGASGGGGASVRFARSQLGRRRLRRANCS